jgi:hypothetical protein
MSHTERMVEIARHKERLIARIAGERAAIAAAIGAWEKPLSVVDKGLAAARYLRAHPLLLVALIGFFVALRRRNLLAWAGRGFAAWRTLRVLSALSGRLFV